MMRLLSLGFIIWTFFSSVVPVNGIKAYRTDQISNSNPYYINFYLSRNKTNSKEGSAEFCDYTNNNACEDVADLVPVSTKKKIPGSEKVIYSLVYPPHTKTHKQLILLIHYDPEYGKPFEPEILIHNETTIFLEFQWTEDKISSRNSREYWSSSFADRPSWNRPFELKQQDEIINISTVFFLIFVIILCVFFGSFSPKWCPTLLPVIYALIYIKYSFNTYANLATLFILIIFLLINCKLSTEKLFVILAIGGVVWEWILMSTGWDPIDPILYLKSFLIHLVLICIAYCLTTDKTNRLTIISSAYIGSTFPLMIQPLHSYSRLPNSYPLDISRYIFCLIGIAIQVKIQKTFGKPAKAKEEPVLLEKACENSDALDSNHDSLRNNLL